MFLSCHDNAGQNHKSFENMADVNDSGTTVTNQIWGILATVQFRIWCLSVSF